MPNTGYKAYLNRRRLILDPFGTIYYNGATWSTDLTEPNTDSYGNPVYSGLGPYFPPVYDPLSCPIGSIQGTFISIISESSTLNLSDITINGVSITATFPFIGITSGGGTTTQIGSATIQFNMTDVDATRILFIDSYSNMYCRSDVGASSFNIDIQNGVTMSVHIGIGVC